MKQSEVSSNKWFYVCELRDHSHRACLTERRAPLAHRDTPTWKCLRERFCLLAFLRGTVSTWQLRKNRTALNALHFSSNMRYIYRDRARKIKCVQEEDWKGVLLLAPFSYSIHLCIFMNTSSLKLHFGDPPPPRPKYFSGWLWLSKLTKKKRQSQTGTRGKASTHQSPGRPECVR